VKKPDAASYKGQDKLNAIMAQKTRRKPTAIPGGGGGGAWMDLGAKGKVEAGLAFGTERTITGTSIFDPVLCELAYRWFCPPGGLILDPFAGGSVRGIVASCLGRPYIGVELRPEQVAANIAQIAIATGPKPDWRVGDSQQIATICDGVEADFLFTCPPYGDLEVYSDDPADISTMAPDDFDAAYALIISAACKLLKRDRFACVVIGDYRDAKGFFRNLPGKTIDAFIAAGLKLYNDAILVTAVGSLPVRAGRQFEAGRKLGNTHQRVLVFVKGDPKKATGAIGPVEFGEIEEGPEITSPA